MVNVVPNLGINTNMRIIHYKSLYKRLYKRLYKNHPSIISIKKFTKNWDCSFAIQHVPKNRITKITKMLDPKKVVLSTDIPTKLIESFMLYIYIQIYIKFLCLYNKMS